MSAVANSGNVLARYTQGTGIDEPLAEVRSGATSYYEADGLGSVTSLSNSSGALANTYTYDSFGNLTASTGTLTNPLRYPARELDSEIGLYFYRARYYDPGNGRFVSEDPSHFDAGLNFYTYVNGDPVRGTDPSGLDIWLEGPSGTEPTGHISMNVGNPNGAYASYSWGVNSDLPGLYPWHGQVYQDVSPNGDFVPGYYLKTTPAEDAQAKAYLDSLLGGQVARYTPWRTCRGWSVNQFNYLKSRGIGHTATPPPRNIDPTDRGRYQVKGLGATATDQQNMTWGDWFRLTYLVRPVF